MIFGASYAEQYDALYLTKDYVAECDLIEQAFGRHAASPSSVLDIGCGTGGHVLELASRGFDCTGVDLSPAMLELAARKAQDRPLVHKPRWINGDAAAFTVDTKFDAAIMMFAVVSYLTDNDDVRAGLANIRRHLKPDGLFICDFWYGPAVLSVRPEDRVRVIESGQGKSIRAASTVLDTFNQTADVSFRLWTASQVAGLAETVETHRMRYFFPQEFKLLLEGAGFESLSLSEFPSLQAPLGDESWNALSIARAV